MEFDALLLARVQFGFTIAFHIIFPTFTIGLSAWIATLEGIWLKTGAEAYHRLARFWTKIFAVSFGMGVVSGIVLSYEFGTNWSRFSAIAGDIVGPLMGYEVLTAFFLEATFLGVMLFGWNRVPPWLHFIASLFVALGTLLSAFWIISANSWMQFPAGYAIREGVAIPTDWIAAIFNPTFPLRLAHMVIAAYLTTAFVVLAVGARYLLDNSHHQHARIMVRMGMGMALVLAPLQIFIGDQHGLQTLEVQPVKIAAMEANWDAKGATPFHVFAVPRGDEERNDFEVSIPYGASLILKHDRNAPIPALTDYEAKDRPPVVPVFFGFRIMLAVGFWFLFLVIWGAVCWWRGTLFTDRRWLQAAWWSWPLGFVAIIAGWIVAEVGRQPWTVTGLLRTADAVSPVQGGNVAASLALFIIVYGIIFSAGIVYINRMIHAGPADPRDAEQTAAGLGRPMSASEGGGGQRRPKEIGT
jgi:cytochrome d ubiquinol oxidase subunit I